MEAGGNQPPAFFTRRLTMSLNWSLGDIKDHQTVCWVTRPCEACGGTGWDTTRFIHRDPDGTETEEERESRCYNCKDEEDPMAVTQMHPLLNCLIWVTMAVDMGRLKA